MNRQDIYKSMQEKQSYLCVGLDTDIDKIPDFLLDYDNPVLEFNKRVIDATKDYCVAYKPNIAFYESRGEQGWQDLKDTLEYIPDDIFTIADAKRGDIGNTSKMYAKTFFEHMNFDSVTVAPYMGSDSVTPFLEYDDKWVILLGLTSNIGSNDFQRIKDINGVSLFEHVIRKSQSWGSADQLMYVIGATHPEDFSRIREMAPDHFLLVPGVGAQGGDLQGVIDYGANDLGGLLINSSRGIIYAGEGEEFQKGVSSAAKKLAEAMKVYF